MHSRMVLSRFHLKYCERCGGLWLRPDGATTPYCPACDRFMADLPRRVLRNQDKAVRRDLQAALALLLLFLAGFPAAALLGGSL